MKRLVPVLLVLTAGCGSGPVQNGATDSLVLKEQKMNSDSAKIPSDPVKRVDYYVTEINNCFLNGELKRRDLDRESARLGTVYAYYENDSMPSYIYTEQGGEFRSEQLIFYLRDNKLIYVLMKNNVFGKDATGEINSQIRKVESERHIYFDGDAIIRDTTLSEKGGWFLRNYDFIESLVEARKELKDAKVTGPR